MIIVIGASRLPVREVAFRLGSSIIKTASLKKTPQRYRLLPEPHNVGEGEVAHPTLSRGGALHDIVSPVVVVGGDAHIVECQNEFPGLLVSGSRGSHL